MNICWRDPKKQCQNAKCCYDASCQAIFEYWKFANSKEWKNMVEKELKRQAGEKKP